MKLTKSLIAPVAFAAVAAALAGCSRTTESLETTDVFAPAAEVAVPAPQLEAQFITAPPAIQSIVQQPQPVFAPPPVSIPAPTFEPVQQVVSAPVSVVAPPPPAYDCSVVPSSKGGLSSYRANCL